MLNRNAHFLVSSVRCSTSIAQQVKDFAEIGNQQFLYAREKLTSSRCPNLTWLADSGRCELDDKLTSSARPNLPVPLDTIENFYYCESVTK